MDVKVGESLQTQFCWPLVEHGHGKLPTTAIGAMTFTDYVIFQKFEHMNISRQLISSTAMAEFSGEFVKVSEPSPHILLVELNRHVHLFDSKNGMQIVELVQKAGECFLQRVCPRFF
jgi:hypothetical protein